ncbi:hypothetical protein SAMN02745784_02623 [Tissierella praeacuta DSM 18095]|uniref:Uncharacterized protein n=1 Tax=Tissierella praeacuta DSM 18095 TaxID=1123404 RepID=A0A1M4YG31_9FIRM|nr:hypothetical protein [Tissierella praeacuta]TCU66441.1 hypothetical protein EV204_11455 [Tissierella praeacuta]SHF04628.1 hypothetical protein SAMN02745784_02623 [Tissierella praeacuta DSM 18095]SUP02056.1 Uncharacterised protein [Tissierella praeacuta]
MFRFYKFKIYEDILIINKSFEESDIRSDSFYDRSYICGISLDELYKIGGIITVKDFDELIYGNKIDLDFFITSDDLREVYDLLEIIDSQMLIRYERFETENYTSKFFYYDIKTNKKIYKIDENRKYVIIYDKDITIILDEDNKRIYDYEFNLVYKCENGFEINDYYENHKDSIYFLIRSSELVKIISINKLNYCIKEIYQDDIYNYEEFDEYKIIDFEKEKFLLIIRYKCEKLFYFFHTLN